MDLKRTYEVSIWSLQDEFITVLKPLNVENIGQLESKELQLRTDDGTNQYSCSIPMYLYQGDQRIINPIWFNTTNGNIVANMRKIKIILNKGAVDNEGKSIEQVYEFLIIKVEERHDKDQVFCDITCEDLAFNELGKIGYKISLSSDKFLDEYNTWAQKHEEDEPEPLATLQYWTDQFLTYLPEDEPTLATKWYYSIEMNWDAYADGDQRSKHKVYEEEYTSSWRAEGGQLVPNGSEKYREKARLIDAEESNIFNLTQELAEKFEVFVRYEYLYDDNYHITGRRIIYYNNYLREQDGYLDITYPYHAASIKREIDGADITTKMFVRPVDEDSVDAGMITIMDVPANKSKEDYIMNFEYMRSIGAITAEQYVEIPKYEYKIRGYNERLQRLASALEVLTDEENKLKASKTLLEAAIDLDKERINEAEDLLNSLDAKDLTIDSVITIPETNPRTAGLLAQGDQANVYYINISDPGVMQETVRIFRTYDYIAPSEQHAGGPLTDEIFGTFINDEFGNLVKVQDLVIENNKHFIVYLTYKYRPALKYEQVRKTWSIREGNDEAELARVSEELEAKTALIEAKSEEYDTLLAEKMDEIARFEQMMGPALRESYWQPEDYKTTGDNYKDKYTFNYSDDPSSGESGYTDLIWDDNLFEDEEKSYYEVSILQEKAYYPCITLTQAQLSYVRENYDKISVMFYDFIAGDETPYEPKNLRHFALGSQAQLAYVKLLDDNDNPIGSIQPVIMLTGIDTASSYTIRNLITPRTSGSTQISPIVGVLKTAIEGGTVTHTIQQGAFAANWLNLRDSVKHIITGGVEETIPVNTPAAFDAWVALIKRENENNETRVITCIDVELWKHTVIYYPRIRINSTLLKKDESITVHANGDLLKEFEDYYILTRSECINPEAAAEEREYTGYNYLTIKPEAAAQHLVPGNKVDFAFTLSNANTVIYLDAVQVLKENSMPKVTYTIEPSFINRDFHYRLYQQLNRIVNVNDLDLKLENVQGYISGLTLDLDVPFNDKIEIKNYRNKFEDLFSNIVAQTEAMKKNAFTVGLAAAAFTSSGILAPAVIQQSINRADLQYAFNQGKLTIDEENGIWATSDDGVVAMRGGGIFTATQKDAEDNWIWNTGILPEGINADLITTGQLDTNLIRIYAGDKLRFQMNGDGLFAYKSIFEDPQLLTLLYNKEFDDPGQENVITNKIESQAGLDLKQYVVHNENGLFLTAEAGSIIKTPEDKLKLLEDNIDRVEISWDGLKLRNWKNEETLSADPDTGDLTLRGTVYATGLYISSGEQDEDIDHYIGGTVDTAVQDAVAGLNIPDDIEYIQQYYLSDNSTLSDADKASNNWQTSIETVPSDKYLWTRVKVINNTDSTTEYKSYALIKSPADTPTTTPSVRLAAAPQMFIKHLDGTYEPSSITVRAYLEDTTVQGWYIDSGTTPVQSTGTTYTLNAPTELDNWTVRTIKIKTNTTDIEDYMTFYILEEAKDGDPGTPGTSPNYAYLTNENISFAANEDGEVLAATTYRSALIAYEGSTEVTPTITSINNETLSEYIYLDSAHTFYIHTTATSGRYNFEIVAAKNSTLGSATSGSIPIVISTPIAATLNINWTKINCGADAEIYEMVLSDSAFIRTDDGIVPNSITLSTNQKVGSDISYGVTATYRYSIYNGSTWSTIADVSGSSFSKDNITANTKMIRFYSYVGGVEQDSQTVPILIGGADGADAYTIVLSNEAHIYPSDETSSTICAIQAYCGTQSQSISIGNITPTINGITWEEDNEPIAGESGSDALTYPRMVQRIKITYNSSVNPNLTNGTLTIPINVYGSSAGEYTPSSTPIISFNRNFSFTISARGASGPAGASVAQILLYQRFEDEPTTSNYPTATLTYDFADNSLEPQSAYNGWTRDIPEGTNPCYVIGATASNSSNTASTTAAIAVDDWSDPPVLFTKNGTNGNNGINTAVVYLYKRAATAPASTDKPAALTYDFATGTFIDENLETKLNGWEVEIPTDDGNICYIITAMAINTAATDTINSDDWSDDPSALVHSGEDGISITSVVDIYYLRTPNHSAPTKPTDSTTIYDTDVQDKWTTMVPTFVANSQYWRCSKYTFSDSNNTISYSEPFYDSSMTDAMIAAQQAIEIANSKNATFVGSNEPTVFKQGDTWYNTTTDENYVASDDSSSTDTQPNSKWVRTNSVIKGTKFIVDTKNGYIQMLAENDISVTGGKLDFTGNGGINIGSGSDIRIAAEGEFTTASNNFNIDGDGNVSATGQLSATSLLIGEGAREGFDDALQGSDTYQDIIKDNLLTEGQHSVLQTMRFTEEDGLIVQAADSPYSTATKNDGFYIRYNDTDIARFTGNVTEVNGLVIGNIIVKKTSRGGWLWTDYTGR